MENKNHKGIIICTILALTLGAFWFFSSKPKPTGNVLPAEPSVPIIKNEVGEKDYQSSSLGISFKYPSNLFVEESAEGLYITSIAPNDPKRESSAMMGALSISVAEGKTLEDIVKTLAQETLSMEEISLDGRKAKEITSTPDGYSGSTWVYLLVETQKGTLKIQYLKDSIQAREYKIIIESIKLK